MLNTSIKIKEVEEKIAISEALISVEKATAMLIFKVTKNMHTLSQIKELTAKPRLGRGKQLRTVLENYNG